MQNIVLNIPHSSIAGIYGPYGKWPRNPAFVNECVNRWTDWYTDLLFASTDPRVMGVVFPYSRFVCDVERLDDDPLEASGQGILYRTFGGYSRGALTEQETAHLLGLRAAHLDALRRHLTPDSLLLDCHSFPGTADDCDVCLGFNDDGTYDERTVTLVKEQFERMHYTVSLNRPYAHAFAPATGFAYRSLMIEVNKRVYMAPDNGPVGLNPSVRPWMRWLGCMDRIYRMLLDE